MIFKVAVEASILALKTRIPVSLVIWPFSPQQLPCGRFIIKPLPEVFFVNYWPGWLSLFGHPETDIFKSVSFQLYFPVVLVAGILRSGPPVFFDPSGITLAFITSSCGSSKVFSSGKLPSFFTSGCTLNLAQPFKYSCLQVTIPIKPETESFTLLPNLILWWEGLADFFSLLLSIFT